MAASQSLVLAAERFGKHKTISQIVCICAILTSLAYPSWGEWARWVFGVPASAPWVGFSPLPSKWAAVILTLLSGSVYLWRNRTVYLRDL